MGIISKAFYQLYLKQYANSDRGFHITSDCTGCGICQNICSADNIVLKNGKPVFKHQCQNCLACLHWCPKNAIHWKNTTVGKQRYHHPNISYHDLKIKNK